MKLFTSKIFVINFLPILFGLFYTISFLTTVDLSFKFINGVVIVFLTISFLYSDIKVYSLNGFIIHRNIIIAIIFFVFLLYSIVRLSALEIEGDWVTLQERINKSFFPQSYSIPLNIWGWYPLGSYFFLYNLDLLFSETFAIQFFFVFLTLLLIFNTFHFLEVEWNLRSYSVFLSIFVLIPWSYSFYFSQANAALYCSFVLSVYFVGQFRRHIFKLLAITCCITVVHPAGIFFVIALYLLPLKKIENQFISFKKFVLVLITIALIFTQIYLLLFPSYIKYYYSTLVWDIFKLRPLPPTSETFRNFNYLTDKIIEAHLNYIIGNVNFVPLSLNIVIFFICLVLFILSLIIYKDISIFVYFTVIYFLFLLNASTISNNFLDLIRLITFPVFFQSERFLLLLFFPIFISISRLFIGKGYGRIKNNEF